MTTTPARDHDEARAGAVGRAAMELCACAFLLLSVAACRSQPSQEPAAPAKENDVPVAINSEWPFKYAVDLYN